MKLGPPRSYAGVLFRLDPELQYRRAHKHRCLCCSRLRCDCRKRQLLLGRVSVGAGGAAAACRLASLLKQVSSPRATAPSARSAVVAYHAGPELTRSRTYAEFLAHITAKLCPQAVTGEWAARGLEAEGPRTLETGSCTEALVLEVPLVGDVQRTQLLIHNWHL